MNERIKPTEMNFKASKLLKLAACPPFLLSSLPSLLPSFIQLVLVSTYYVSGRGLAAQDAVVRENRQCREKNLCGASHPVEHSRHEPQSPTDKHIRIVFCSRQESNMVQ